MVYHSDELVASLANRVAEHDGPVYLRVSRADVPTVFNDWYSAPRQRGDYQPQIGKGTVLRAVRPPPSVGRGEQRGLACLA